MSYKVIVTDEMERATIFSLSGSTGERDGLCYHLQDFSRYSIYFRDI